MKTRFFKKLPFWTYEKPILFKNPSFLKCWLSGLMKTRFFKKLPFWTYEKPILFKKVNLFILIKDLDYYPYNTHQSIYLKQEFDFIALRDFDCYDYGKRTQTVRILPDRA